MLASRQWIFVFRITVFIDNVTRAQGIKFFYVGQNLFLDQIYKSHYNMVSHEIQICGLFSKEKKHKTFELEGG